MESVNTKALNAIFPFGTTSLIMQGITNDIGIRRTSSDVQCIPNVADDSLFCVNNGDSSALDIGTVNACATTRSNMSITSAEVGVISNTTRGSDKYAKAAVTASVASAKTKLFDSRIVPHHEMVLNSASSVPRQNCVNRKDDKCISETHHVEKLMTQRRERTAQNFSMSDCRAETCIVSAKLWDRKKSRRLDPSRPKASVSLPKIQTSAYNMRMARSIYNRSNEHDTDGTDLQKWLLGMRETSPPKFSHTTSIEASPTFGVGAKYIEGATSSKDMELNHRDWMEKHPSALDKLEEIVEAASGKRVAVFLDYDGTLSPIVEDPDRAFMSQQMRAIVKEVANVFPTAIISGRCKEKLHEFVQLPELYYAGSHGLEIIGPATVSKHVDQSRASQAKGNGLVLFQPAKDFTNVINKVFHILDQQTRSVPGARVEHNKFCVSVHFRCVKEKHWIGLASCVQRVVESFPNLRLTQGRKVLEIRPLIAWNKGKALDFLLKSLGLNDPNTVFPIYLGDDRSDEDAFKVLNRKKHGLGILVSAVAKETNAVCSLRDPSEVGELLKRLVMWKQKRLFKYL